MNVKFLSDLAIKWLTQEEARREHMGVAAACLLAPLRFEFDGRKLDVPAWFVTDHASVPRIFWSIFPPVDPRWSRPAVVHDYGYRFGMFPIEGGGFLRFNTREAVDDLFLSAMEAEGAGWMVRHALYRAVRMGGGITWNKYRKGEQIMVEQIKRVQKALGVAVDGVAGPITWGAIAARVGINVAGLAVPEMIRRVQACLGVAVDGIAGPQTWGAVEKAVTGNPIKAQPVSNSQRLLAHARKDNGLREVPGPGSNPRIKQAILEAASWLDPDDSKTAWCGCIMGLWCKELGLPVPAEYFRAANWLNVGTPVDLKDAEPGDIVVISRSGGNHVALFVDSALTLFGGNQGNAVNSAAFDRSALRGIRRL